LDTEDIGYSRLTPKATRYSFDWWRILKRVHAGAAAVGNPLAAVVLARLPASSADASAMRYAVALLVVSTVRLVAEGTLEWLAYVTSSVYIMHRGDWICRLWKFLPYCSLSSAQSSFSSL